MTPFDYRSTCHEGLFPVQSESGPSWQGKEMHDTKSKTYYYTHLAAQVQHRNTTINYNMLMLTYTLISLNDNLSKRMLNTPLTKSPKRPSCP